MPGRRLAALAVVLVLTGCGTRPETSGPDVTEAKSARADASTCRAVEPIGAVDTTNPAKPNLSIEEARMALAAAPPEIQQSIRDLIALRERMEADPSLDVVDLGEERLTASVRTGHAVRDWYRRNCGPDTATSPFCETFAQATLERDVSAMALLVAADASDNPNESLGLLTAGTMGLGARRLRAILPVTPPELTASVQVLIDDFERFGREDQPTSAERRAATDAQTAVLGAVREQCGIRLTTLAG